VTAVGEHGELHAGGPAVGEQRLDRGADRAARVEDVVDDHDRHPVDVEGDVAGVDDRLVVAAADVVAVEGDVDVAVRQAGVEQVLDERVDAPAEHRAAAVDPDDREPLGLRVLLHDLVRDPYERAPDVVLVEDDLL
jgi:hypothetical protein